MNLLFVCTENRLRSATAEEVFGALPGLDAIGAGTNADAPTPVSGDLIEWADLILAMEPVHRRKVNQRFGPLLRDRRVVVLGIADRYDFMQPELVRALREAVGRHVAELPESPTTYPPPPSFLGYAKHTRGKQVR